MTPDFAQRAVKSRRNPLSGFTSRDLTAWIAIIGLYLQIASSAICGMAAPVDTAFASPDRLFPICHAAMGDDDAGQTNDGNAPVDQHSCPACSIHCHASVVLAPAIHVARPLRIVTASAVSPSFVVPSAIRFETTALPRGPPSAG